MESIMKKIYLSLCVAFAFALMTGCQTTDSTTGTTSSPGTAGAPKIGMKLTDDPKRSVPVGTEFVGQRYFSEKFMYWGFVRPEKDAWGKSTRIVMLREEVPAPDRAPNGPRGRDDGTIYLLKGYFSGEIAYEPKSDLMLDVFVLQGYEVVTEHNKPINANTPFWVSDRMYYRNNAAGVKKQGSKVGNRFHEDMSTP